MSNLGSKKILVAVLFLAACSTKEESKSTEPEETTESSANIEMNSMSVTIEAEDFNSSSEEFETSNGYVVLDEEGWLQYEVSIPTAGRYRTKVYGSSGDGGVLWVEDYVDNKDGRTYNITGDISISSEEAGYYVEGSPLNNVSRIMKVHSRGGGVAIDKISFELMLEHQLTPQTFTQNMEGENWELVWSDEFDGEALDESKWLYDVGNWGWGNNELQYYTMAREENTRIEDGVLIIEARKNDMGERWTSARITTRGRESFLYGKIEFRARVPREKGNWAAGWTLGDDYVDEISWPYCGEIDILESVGYEVDNETGDGIAHATVHTPAYYFKINNQISSTKDISNIAGEFHTYSVIWTPTEVRGLVDGEEYYLYDKNANEREWPFNKPQNIILNLAMGGGWGGAQGMDESVTSQKFEIDYVRVYELN